MADSELPHWCTKRGFPHLNSVCGSAGTVVTLETYSSNVFGTRWALARKDGKTEATGFRSPGEATEWARENGYVLDSSE